MTTADWSPWNLDRHYDKHPAGEDKDCWCDLLGQQPGPISKDDYKKASIDIQISPWLVFQAGYKEKQDQTKYFVDDRQCLTAVHVSSNEIKTCYHDHKDRRHCLLYGVEGKIAFLKKWCKKQLRPNPEVVEPRIEKLNVDPRTRKLIQTYVQMFTAPPRGQGRKREAAKG